MNNKIVRLAVVLLAISGVTGIILGGVYTMTLKPIEAVQQQHPDDVDAVIDGRGGNWWKAPAHVYDCPAGVGSIRSRYPKSRRAFATTTSVEPSWKTTAGPMPT